MSPPRQPLSAGRRAGGLWQSAPGKTSIQGPRGHLEPLAGLGGSSGPGRSVAARLPLRRHRCGNSDAWGVLRLLRASSGQPASAMSRWRRRPSTASGAWWSITEAGNCDRAYRYPVRVANGSITLRRRSRHQRFGKGRPQRQAERQREFAASKGRMAPGICQVRSGAGKWSGRSATDAMPRPLGSRKARRLGCADMQTPATMLRAF